MIVWNDETTFSNVKLIENKDNSGFPKGIIQVYCKGEYICILNPDTVVAEDTLQKYWLSPKGKDPESWVN
jgi:GT2 family glycosyltransferase